MGKDENNNIRLISEGNITTIPYNEISHVFAGSHIEDWLNVYFKSHLDSNIESMLQNTSYCTEVADSDSSSRTTCSSAVTGKHNIPSCYT